MMNPQENEECDYVRALARFVYGGRMSQPEADQQLIERYGAFDADGKAALRKAVTLQQQYAQQLADNLGSFDSIDAKDRLTQG